MWDSRARLCRAVGVVYAAALALTPASSAQAFDLKHTQGGLDVRWAVPRVAFVVDPRLNEAVASGAEAVADAVEPWSGVAGAPLLSAATGPVSPMPALDEKNSVLFLHDFAAADGALAITIVSLEEATGYIVDTDIVINANHAFAVLPAGARASSNSPLVSTEGSSQSVSSQVFDLTHVTAHEIGHSLGLADEAANAAALMYPYTRAGDASIRTPGSDDLSGIDQDYAGADLGSGSAQGCGGGASVAGRRATHFSSPAALLLIVAGGWLASRRWRRGLAPVAILLATLLLRPGRAQSAHPSSVEATAHVTAATTAIVDGVFQTTVDLSPRTCQVAVCPAHATARVWGGTIGGITQQVGANVVPGPRDEVDVTFQTDPRGLAPTTAVILAVRPIAAASP
jgi:hypothetical protein